MNKSVMIGDVNIETFVKEHLGVNARITRVKTDGPETTIYVWTRNYKEGWVKTAKQFTANHPHIHFDVTWSNDPPADTLTEDGAGVEPLSE